MKKIIATFIALVIICPSSYFAYKHHKRSDFVEEISPSIKNASIRTNNSIRIDIDDTSITFGELFKRLENDIEELDKQKIEVQSIATSANSDIANPSVDYLQAAQEFSRALASKYRKSLALSNSTDAVDEAIAELRGANSYNFQYAKRRGDAAIERMDKATKEVFSSREDLVKSSKKLLESREKLVVLGVFSNELLVDVQGLKNVIEKNESKEKGEKAEGAKNTKAGT